MIEVIVATVGLSITAITCSSLWLVSVLDKRERRDDEADNDLVPYVLVTLGTPCVACGAPVDIDVVGNMKQGPRPPKACQSKGCRARGRPHLHVNCMTCGSYWLMAAKPVAAAKPEAA